MQLAANNEISSLKSVFFFTYIHVLMVVDCSPSEGNFSMSVFFTFQCIDASLALLSIVMYVPVFHDNKVVMYVPVFHDNKVVMYVPVFHDDKVVFDC